MKEKNFLRKVRNHVFLHKEPRFVCMPEMFESYGQLIGVSKDKIYRHYLFCVYRYGVKPNQYVLWDFYRKNNRSKNRYVGDIKNNRICKKVNPMLKNQQNDNCFTNKITFNKVFSDFIHRAWISTEATVDEIAHFLHAHGKVIVKPIDGMGGHGIYILNIESDNCIETARELKKENLLLEEVVNQCDEMSSLHPSSVNTVRIVSYIDKNGKTFILGAIVRVGVGNMVIDNQSSGGILFPVDISEGFICGYGVNSAGQIYFELPDTHEMMLGFRIPKWKALIEYIKSAAAVVPSQKMIGWDICIGINDFIIIEGNLMSGAVTHQTNFKGNRELLNM